MVTTDAWFLASISKSSRSVKVNMPLSAGFSISLPSASSVGAAVIASILSKDKSSDSAAESCSFCALVKLPSITSAMS